MNMENDRNHYKQSEDSSSQENREQAELSHNSGLSRREVLKKAAWMAPVILSAQLSGKAFAQMASCSHPGDNDPPPCTSAGDPSICGRCEIKACDSEGCLTCDNEATCPNNCDWCDGGILDFCNPNF